VFLVEINAHHLGSYNSWSLKILDFCSFRPLFEIGVILVMGILKIYNP